MISLPRLIPIPRYYELSKLSGHLLQPKFVWECNFNVGFLHDHKKTRDLISVLPYASVSVILGFNANSIEAV